MFDTTRPGTYALIYHCPTTVATSVGRLGPVVIAPGCWVYVGSAFGPGGLQSRLRHHLRPSQRPHWHLDYIKDHLQLRIVWVTCDPLKREHLWAATLAAMAGASRPIAGFGASDCTCPAHLIHCVQRPSLAAYEKALRRHCPEHHRLAQLHPGTIFRE